MKYSQNSLYKLSTVDPVLRQVFMEALATDLVDITIVCGVRSKAEQDSAYNSGHSKLKWPNSKHNIVYPSDRAMAVDAAPFIDGKVSFKLEDCAFLAGIVLTIANDLGVNIRWGGCWKMDGRPFRQSFVDAVHYEISLTS